MRWIKMAVAAYCAMHCVNAAAVPVTMTQNRSDSFVAFHISHVDKRYGDFTLQDSTSTFVELAQFDPSLGTLLSAEVTLTSLISHDTRRVYLPDYRGQPFEMQFGAIAQDTEYSTHGPANLWAYYDASVAYRADYRMTMDPFLSSLFAPTAAEAAFGDCFIEEDLFGDIGNSRPSCRAGNNGSTLQNFDYSWGPLTGTALEGFVGTHSVGFNPRMTGSAYGHCDDDGGDYCVVNLATEWLWNLSMTYIFEPYVSGPGSGGNNGGGNNGGGGNPTPVPEPAALSMMAFGLLAMGAMRRRCRVTS